MIEQDWLVGSLQRHFSDDVEVTCTLCPRRIFLRRDAFKVAKKMDRKIICPWCYYQMIESKALEAMASQGGKS